MKYICYLEKGNYQIRVNVNMFGTYQLEYSDDGFRTRTRKKYKDKEYLMSILRKRFTNEELKPILDEY